MQSQPQQTPLSLDSIKRGLDQLKSYVADPAKCTSMEALSRKYYSLLTQVSNFHSDNASALAKAANASINSELQGIHFFLLANKPDTFAIYTYQNETERAQAYAKSLKSSFDKYFTEREAAMEEIQRKLAAYKKRQAAKERGEEYVDTDVDKETDTEKYKDPDSLLTYLGKALFGGIGGVFAGLYAGARRGFTTALFGGKDLLGPIGYIPGFFVGIVTGIIGAGIGCVYGFFKGLVTGWSEGPTAAAKAVVAGIIPPRTPKSGAEPSAVSMAQTLKGKTPTILHTPANDSTFSSPTLSASSSASSGSPKASITGVSILRSPLSAGSQQSSGKPSAGSEPGTPNKP